MYKLFCGCLNLKSEYYKLAVVLFSCVVVLLVFSGCESRQNPDISTTGIVDKIGDKATPHNNYSDVEPTPVQDPSNTSVPYDPVINFTDPYFESVIRNMIGKSIGDIVVSDVSGITSLKARVKGYFWDYRQRL